MDEGEVFLLFTKMRDHTLLLGFIIFVKKDWGFLGRFFKTPYLAKDFGTLKGFYKPGHFFEERIFHFWTFLGYFGISRFKGFFPGKNWQFSPFKGKESLGVSSLKSLYFFPLRGNKGWGHRESHPIEAISPSRA